jgi:dUTPase
MFCALCCARLSASTESTVRECIDTARSSLAARHQIRYLNVNGLLADGDGKLREGVMNSNDKLHPTEQGYQVWADALNPLLIELLGPPSKEDHAPAPTGDPSARR